MAPSPQNPRRPRLGTVLSRKNWDDRRSNSTISSVVSQGPRRETSRGSFDPEHEALASTEPLGYPPLVKDARISPKNEPYEIEVKAARAALSEGSETGSDVGDLSIEVGRGGRVGQGIGEDSRNNDSIHSSNAMIGEYRVMYSPPLSTRRLPTNGNNKDKARSLGQVAQARLESMGSQKENRDPALQPFKSFKSTDISNRAKRKTLAEINARASGDYDGSLLNEDRPGQANHVTKTTRFSRSNRNPSNHLWVSDPNTATATADVNQSYILPDLPNISQLMPGKTAERTPGRGHLAAHPALSQTPRGPTHQPINAVPIPADEKAIFVSLNLLQGKVSDLEAATTKFQKTIEELKTKNLVLKAEKRDLKADNERLRKENVELRMVYAQFGQHHQQDQHQDENQSSAPKQRHANAAAQVRSEFSKILKEQQEEDLFSLTPTASVKLRPTSGLSESTDFAARKGTTDVRLNSQQRQAISNLGEGKKVVIDENTTKPGDYAGRNTAREQTLIQDMTYLTNPPVPHYLLGLRKMLEAERVDAKHRKNGAESHEGVSAATQKGPDTTAAPSMAQSALPRKSSMKDGSQRIHLPEVAAPTHGQIHEGKENMSRRSCKQDFSEDISGQASRPLSHMARRNSDPTATAASNTSRRRRAAFDLEDENMTSGFILPDITISQPTAANAAAAAAAAAAVATAVNGAAINTEAQFTDAPRHVIHSNNTHDAANCIVCSRVTTAISRNDNSAEKKTIIVPKPVAVSDTPVLPSLDNPDPTIRPAQAPGVALAIVLKELSDQHEHLKARLATAQASYQQTDPRLSRARRARLTKEIDRLQRRCDRAADMIYRLYDVLEGQRRNGGVAAGLEISQELEVTVMGLREVVGQMGRAQWDEGRSGSESEGEAGVEME